MSEELNNEQTEIEKNKETVESGEELETINTETVEETVEGAERISEEQQQINKLTEEKAELVDKLQRQIAEFENFRKRTIKEKASMYDDGVVNSIEKLLPVIDNFDRAMMTETNKEENFYVGIEMIYKQFGELFASIGVETIKTVGETFDANLHYAVQNEENPDFGENTVSLEMQKGYKYKEKVIRPAMVKVANC